MRSLADQCMDASKAGNERRAEETKQGRLHQLIIAYQAFLFCTPEGYHPSAEGFAAWSKHTLEGPSLESDLVATRAAHAAERRGEET